MLKQLLYHSLVNYFRYFAHQQLRKNPRATVIGITGSAGKSSTRQALVSILKTRGIVKSSPHANSEIGIPLDILGLRFHTLSLFDWLRLIVLAPYRAWFYQEKYTYYVLEMGIDSPAPPKNMQYLLSIISPHVGVVLNAGLTHASAFDHLLKDKSPTTRLRKLIGLIAKEKMQLVKSIPKQGVAVINLDQTEFKQELKNITARVLSFGKHKQADIQILKNFRFKYQGHIYQLKPSQPLPAHFAYSFAAALSVASALGIPVSRSTPLLSTYRPPPGRLRILSGINQATIIDSSYNASPSAMQDALAFLKQQGGRRHKIAIIGDMRELGQSAKQAHKNLASWIKSSCDQAILFGPLTHDYTYPLLTSHGFPVRHFTLMVDLISYLSKNISPKSYLLFKGSQNNILLERAVEAVLASKSDLKFLARRGKIWDKKRAQTN